LVFAAVLAHAHKLQSSDYRIHGLGRLGADTEKDVMYSGLMPLKLTNNDKGAMFFWHNEARHEATDGEEIPMVIWLNGGPGCSSNVGLFYENGPYTMSADPDPAKKYHLNFNKYSWSEVAHTLYVEQPLRTGFSVPSNDYKDPRVENEGQVSSDFHDFLQSFFAIFPERKNSPLFIFGESYAGRYVPAIAQEIVSRGEIELTGIAIGNGVIDHLQDTSYAEFAYSHGLIPLAAKELIDYKVAHCTPAPPAPKPVYPKNDDEQAIADAKKAKATSDALAAAAADAKKGIAPPTAPIDDCDMMSQVVEAAGNPNGFNSGTFIPYDNIFQSIYNQLFNDPDMLELIHVAGDNVPGTDFTNGQFKPLKFWTSCSDAVEADMAEDKPRVAYQL